jgi:proliferating cell nuclear antigen
MILKTTSSPEIWRMLIKAAAVVSDEITFSANEEGISYRVMDPSHVAMIDVFWPNAAFGKYSFEGDKEIRFTLRLADLQKIFSRAERGDYVGFDYHEDKKQVNIAFWNSYCRNFSLNTLEPPEEKLPPLKIEFKAKIRLTGAVLQRVISDVSTISDYTVIEANKDEVVFSSKSELGSIEATLRRADPNVLDFEVTDAQKAAYSLQYLSGVMKANPQTVDLWFTSKAPLKLRFQLSEAGGYVDFYLASRAEEK